ncbi:MAG: ParB/RepB/Spo0J family partition protein [Acidimicrobiales bacterium]|nr:ParB/RepB/Spo0J family partition protein [Acidimicrobiales bacterium]
MARPQGGLGRGLGALIPSPSPTDTARTEERKSLAASDNQTSGVTADVERLGAYIEIPLEEIGVNQLQPRKAFDDDALKVLADSIERFGVLQPVVVRSSSGAKPFELVAGERRWRASQLAGKSTIPAVIRNSDPESSLVEALVENLHREDLNPLEEAAAFQHLVEDFGVTHGELGERLGKARTTISNSLRLLELPTEIQLALVSGELTAGHARALLACDSESLRTGLLHKIVRENLSVREAEEIARGSSSTPKRGLQPKRGTSLPEASALEVEKQLGDYLNTTVSVQMTQKRGKLVIDFATISDLQRIYDLIYTHRERLNREDH